LPISSFTIAANSSIGQNKKSVEIDVLGRFDKHANYTTRYFNRSYTNDTELWGKSIGINVNYIHPIGRNLKLKSGLGYYKLSVDKIRQTTPFGYISKGRAINYPAPDGNTFGYGTSKYHYNCLDITGGITYINKFYRGWNYSINVDLIYLYTFSQAYNVSGDIKYRANHGRTLGWGINSGMGLIRKFSQDKYYINPRIIVPVFQNLKGDIMFGETSGTKMQKWFNGMGFSLAFGLYLN
jgi:hypothetical protein